MLVAHFYFFPTDKDSESASGSFGPYHALILFLFFGAVAVTAYLCMHNRKKVSEFGYCNGSRESFELLV